MDPLPHGIHFLEKIKGSLCLFFVDVVYINLPWRIFGSWRGLLHIWDLLLLEFEGWRREGGIEMEKGREQGSGGYKDPFFAFQAFSTFGTCCCWSLKVGGGRVGSRWSRGVDKVFKDGG